MANRARWFIYVFIVTARNLIEVARQYFDDFESTHSGADIFSTTSTVLYAVRVRVRVPSYPVCNYQLLWV